MESKLAGGLFLTLCVMEQELRSIYQKLDQLEQTTEMDSLPVALAHLQKSIVALTSSFAEAESIRMEQ